MDTASKQKVNKETEASNDTVDGMDLTDILRPFHPNAKEYTFFSSAHGTFSRTDHILGYKSNLSKFKFYQASSKNGKNTNTWRLSNTFLNNRLLKK